MSLLQIGSWNIGHLSGQSRAANRQSAFALADHIEMAGIDLLVLQEIDVTAAEEEVRLSPTQPVIAPRATTARRNADLDVVCYLLEEHLDVPWRYQILPNRTSGDKSQPCGVLWNTERLTLSSVRPLDVSHGTTGARLWDRKPHVVTFNSDIMAWRRADSYVAGAYVNSSTVK